MILYPLDRMATPTRPHPPSHLAVSLRPLTEPLPEQDSITVSQDYKTLTPVQHLVHEVATTHRQSRGDRGNTVRLGLQRLPLGVGAVLGTTGLDSSGLGAAGLGSGVLGDRGGGGTLALEGEGFVRVGLVVGSRQKQKRRPGRELTEARSCSARADWSISRSSWARAMAARACGGGSEDHLHTDS